MKSEFPAFSETHPVAGHALSAVRFVAFTLLRFAYPLLRFALMFGGAAMALAALVTAFYYRTFFPAAGLVAGSVVLFVALALIERALFALAPDDFTVIV